MPTHRRSFHLAREAASVSAGRRHLHALMVRWHIELDEDARVALDVVSSELITNAVRHSVGTRLTVGVCVDSRRARARLEVRDGSRAMPCMRRAAPDEENGRGLLLVQHLALSHGAHRTRRGKRVWAEIALPSQAATPLLRRLCVSSPGRRIARCLCASTRAQPPPPVVWVDDVVSLELP